MTHIMGQKEGSLHANYITVNQYFYRSSVLNLYDERYTLIIHIAQCP